MEEIKRWIELEGDWFSRMLGEIDESMQNRYYPFILEDIPNFYDRVKVISVFIIEWPEL